MIIATVDHLDGKSVAEYFDAVYVTEGCNAGIISAGSRAKDIQKTIERCKLLIGNAASKKGANAVLGLRISVAPQGSSALATVTLMGTPVKLV